MTTEWDSQPGESDEADAGMLGGGGPAETMDEEVGDEADEHGDRLAHADEEQL